MQNELFDLYWINVKFIEEISYCVQAIRQQNYHLMRVQMPKVIQIMTEWLQLLEKEDIKKQLSQLVDRDVIVDTLQQIERALQAEDYILVADLYELLMRPILIELQCEIRKQNTQLMQSKWLKNNLDVIKRVDIKLYQKLNSLKWDVADRDVYQVEETTIGSYTMAIHEEGRKYYLHSNNNPISEARMFAQRIYDVNKERYIVVGWGMGYHVKELLSIDPDLDIIIFEPDLKLLYRAFQYIDQVEILEKVRFVTHENELQRYIQTDYQLVLYRPELGHLENEDIKKKLLRIAERQDSIETHKNIFRQNYRSNIQCCTGYIDDIQGMICGKRVLVVAGGPSLDRNIDQLVDKPENLVIIAVGTVYKLLLKKNIKIDLVVFSDVAAYPQIQGIEEQQIPIAILSTADGRISKYYQGPKYLVCQQGYEIARKYAENKGYMCYDSGGSVATLALDMMIRLKAASIAFVGLDLAYIGEKAHASGTRYETFSGERMQMVLGLNDEKLNTSQAFNNYRLWMEKRIQKPEVSMPIIDATEGGARKKGFIVMTLQEYFYYEKR